MLDVNSVNMVCRDRTGIVFVCSHCQEAQSQSVSSVGRKSSVWERSCVPWQMSQDSLGSSWPVLCENVFTLPKCSTVDPQLLLCSLVRPLLSELFLTIYEMYTCWASCWVYTELSGVWGWALNHFLSAPQSHLPFAVVGSTEEVKIGNKMVKARQYPWGTVQGKSGSHYRKWECALSHQSCSLP